MLAKLESIEVNDRFFTSGEGYRLAMNLLSHIKRAILKQKKNENTGKVEWALVSRKNPDKVLKWFGVGKPTEEEVKKEERRVQFFKNYKT